MTERTRAQALAKRLASELDQPSPTKNWGVRYWLGAAVWFVLMGVATFLTARTWPDLAYVPHNLIEPRFATEVVLWFVLAAVCAKLTYQSSFPVWASPMHKILKRVAAVLALGLIGSALSRVPADGLASEVTHQLNWSVGACGFFILIFGVCSATWMALTVRKAAPVSLVETGAWSAALAASASVMYMHLVCRHDTMSHIIIWHMVPAVILISLGVVTARKVLAW
jgi:hypothetical protein